MKNFTFYKNFGLWILALLLGLSMNSSGQILLKDIEPGIEDSRPDDFFEYNGTLYFSTETQFWTTDGTEEGTVMVKDIDLSGDEALAVCNDKIYMNAEIDGVDDLYKLYISDGTTDGTVVLKDISPNTDVGATHFTEVNDLVVFRAQDGGADGFTTGNKELWVTDGTTEGTVLLKDIWAGDESSRLSDFTPFGNSVLFSAKDETMYVEYDTKGDGLWITNGTAAGTVLLKSFILTDADGDNDDVEFITVVGDEAFFKVGGNTYGSELWKTDGTQGGTVMVKDINPLFENSGAAYLTNVNGTLFFKANDGVHGKELWKSDGTESGTVLVKDIRLFVDGIGDGSQIEDIFAVGDICYFRASDFVGNSELWKSDGTEAGTLMVKDINPTGSSFPNILQYIKGNLFFTADDGTHGEELWRTDGTEEGTVMITDINSGGDINVGDNSFFHNDIFYFRADDAVHGRELWISRVLSITTQPTVSTTTCAGNQTIISVEAIGESLSYQWQKDGVDIVGETSSSLIMANPKVEDVGNYKCIIEDGFFGDILTSDNAELIVNPATEITTQPVASTSALESDAAISLVVAASGTGTLTYLWSDGNGELSGETASTLSIATDPANSGTYFVSVTGDCGDVQSDDAVVSIDLDTDSDGVGNATDTDDDGDGTLDDDDAFPLDDTEDTDTDGDGTGDNADTDADDDGTLDVNDAFPLDDTEDTDTDGDGTGDNADTDADDDGTLDEDDAFPLDDTEDTDTDGDGTGDNADTDDDDDGTLDGDDAFPLDDTEDTDTDSDGIGNNADTDDDNDGVLDEDDMDPLDPDVGTFVGASSLIKVELYPNPVNDILYFRNISRESFNVKVFDMLGALVMNKDLSENFLNVDDLRQGVYFVLIEDQTFRIVKE